MTHEVVPAPAVRRALQQLPEPVAAAVIEFLAGPLAQNPRRVGEPLTGELRGLFSARRGEYRVVYAIDEAARTVTVLRVSHRRAAYR